MKQRGDRSEQELNLFVDFFVIVCVYVCDNVYVCVNVYDYDYGYEKCLCI